MFIRLKHFLKLKWFKICCDLEHIDIFGHRTSFEVYVRNRKIDGIHDFNYITNFGNNTNCQNYH